MPPPEAGESLVARTPYSRVIALDATNGKLCAGLGQGTVKLPDASVRAVGNLGISS